MTTNRYNYGFLKQLMFSHCLYLYLEPRAPLPIMCPILPHIPIPLMSRNIYKDFPKNFPYFIRKSNITIKTNLENILYNILYMKEMYTNWELEKFFNNFSAMEQFKKYRVSCL